MGKTQKMSAKPSASPVLSVEEAKLGDLDQMIEIFKTGQQPHHEKFPDIFGPGDDKTAIAQYLRGFFKPRNPFRKRSGYALCWYVDGKPSGYLLYQLYETSNIFHGKPHWVCFVEDVAISPDARKLGGASALMERLMQLSSGLGHCIVSGHIWRDNDASEALFRKSGFDDLSKCFYRINS